MSSEHLIKNKRIAVVGGGPAGMTLTRLLQIRGANVILFERDTDRTARIQGGSLDIHSDSGQLAIRAAGLYDGFLKKIRPGGGNHVVVDKYGVVQFFMPDLKMFNSRPEIDRGDLRDLFLDSLEPGTVQWNHHLLEVKQLDDGVWLKFKGGREEKVDLLIGADGHASKIRPLVTDISGVYSGIFLIQSEIDNPQKDCPKIYDWANCGNMFAMSDSKFIVGQQKTSGSMVIYFSSRQTEGFAKESNLLSNDQELARQYLLKEFGDWDKVFIDLINESTKVPITTRNLNDTARFNKDWEVNPFVTLVGDCAHVMPPFAGDGANMAMVDSLELANELTSPKNKTIEEAIGKYQVKMLKRTRESGNVTNEAMHLLHCPNALDNFVSIVLPGPFKYLKPFLPAIINFINRIYDLYVYYFKSGSSKPKNN